MIEHIEARIAELEKEAADFLTGANQRMAAYNGAIGELKKLKDKVTSAAVALAVPQEAPSGSTPE